MKASFGFLASFLLALVLSGCVTSHYVNDKGYECTRRYLTPVGISTHSCSEAKAVVQPAKAQGEVLKVAPAPPEPSLRKSTPARTIEQNIKSTTQSFGR